MIAYSEKTQDISMKNRCINEAEFSNCIIPEKARLCCNPHLVPSFFLPVETVKTMKTNNVGIKRRQPEVSEQLLPPFHKPHQSANREEQS